MGVMAAPSPRRIVVAISGASGAAYGVGLLRALRDAPDVETHLVVSPAGHRTLRHELDVAPGDLAALAHRTHAADDVGACIASGSFRAWGMAVAPCSMRTLAAIAHGLGDNLLTRAADVMLKERRRLVLLTRESPLNLAHLRNMVCVTEMGGVICPPVPAMYLRPATVQAVIDHSVARMLDLLDVPHGLCARWGGEAAS